MSHENTAGVYFAWERGVGGRWCPVLFADHPKETHTKHTMPIIGFIKFIPGVDIEHANMHTISNDFIEEKKQLILEDARAMGLLDSIEGKNDAHNQG